MSYDNTNRVSIWGNKDKTEAKHPDYKGTVNIEGVEYEVGLWKRKPDASPKSPALSGSIKLKQVPPPQQAAPQPAPAGDFDDDLPF